MGVCHCNVRTTSTTLRVVAAELSTTNFLKYSQMELIFLYKWLNTELEAFRRTMAAGDPFESSIVHPRWLKEAEVSWFCSDCSTEHAKWVGRCTACKQWNTVKDSVPKSALDTLDIRAAGSRRNPENGTRGCRWSKSEMPKVIVKFVGREFDENGMMPMSE